MTPGKAALDLLYPMNAQCLGCGDPSGADRNGFCGACLKELERLTIRRERGRCARCGLPLRGGGCPRCEVFGANVGSAASAFAYRGPVANAVRRFKFGGVGAMSAWMAERMLRCDGAEALVSRADVIVCAPMGWIRRNRRGYNQAWLLARRLSGLTGLPVVDALARSAFSRHQVARLTHERRARHRRGKRRHKSSAYACAPN